MSATRNDRLVASVRQGLCVLSASWTLSAGLELAAHAGASPSQEPAASQHVRCSLLVGNRVSSAPDADGKRADLGTAHDFLLAGATGRVTHVIVRSGGVAGIGDTLRCFDIAALSIDPVRDSQPALALAISQTAFAAAPSIGERDLDPFRAEIIATQGHGDGEPPERFVPRAPILLMSDLNDLELANAEDGRRLRDVHDAWLELGQRTVAYVTVGGPTREVPVPLSCCSIVGVPRARVLQLCVDLGDTAIDAAPALSASDSGELDDDLFRRKVAAHYSARVAQLARKRARPRRGVGTRPRAR
jgi:hypothetical protein